MGPFNEYVEYVVGRGGNKAPYHRDDPAPSTDEELFQELAIEDVLTERRRQVVLWGSTNGVEGPHGNNERRLRILVEEVGEVAAAMNDGESLDRVREEVTQTAAVALAWCQGLYADEACAAI